MCVEKKQQSNKLRLILFLTSVVSLGLSIPYLVVFGGTTPIIGLVVCAFTSFVSLLSYPWRKTLSKVFRRRSNEYRIILTADDEDDDKLPRTFVNGHLLFFSDALLATLSLLVYILGTMELDRGYRRWWGNGDILGTYATLPYLVNFALHGYLAIVELRAILKELPKALANCPHCHKSLTGAASPSDDNSDDRGDRDTRMRGGIPPESAEV